MLHLNLQELLELDDRTILFGSDSRGNRYLGQMLALYTETFGEPCTGCPKKYPIYLKRLKQFQMKKEKKEGLFQLEKAVTIPIFGTSEVYSDENITDEAALKILSRNPNAINLFKKKPENWEELVEAYKKGETEINSLEDLKELKVTAIRVLFPEAKGRSKEELIADIAEKYPELSKPIIPEDTGKDDGGETKDEKDAQNQDGDSDIPEDTGKDDGGEKPE